MTKLRFAKRSPYGNAFDRGSRYARDEVEAIIENNATKRRNKVAKKAAKKQAAERPASPITLARVSIQK